MRTIKFRGKRIDNGEWAYGYVFYSIPDCPYIIQPSCDVIVTLLQVPAGLTVSPSRVHKVHPDTVGQYTGLKDNLGVEIFEGDIVRYYTGTTVYDNESPQGREEYSRGKVIYEDYAFTLGGHLNLSNGMIHRLEIIGTIHDKEKT